MAHYPINVDLSGRRCVVVGGGAVAERKVESLIAFGAAVVVVAPEVTPALREMAERGVVEHVCAPYESRHLNGAFLAIAATDDREVNKAVYSDAQTRAILVNVVDDPELCVFYVPAVVRRGDFLISVSTSGKAPAMAKRIREQLEMRYGPEYGELVELMGELREEIKSRYPSSAGRMRAYSRILDSDALRLLAEGKRDEARQRARQCI